MQDIFNRYYKKYDAWYDKNRFAYLSELAAIKKVLPKGGKGLEIGAGTARFTQPLGIACGIEPAKNMAKIARQKGVDVKLGRGEKLPFARAVFDYVAIIITLSFVDNPQKVLREAKRVLKRKGKIILGIIDRDSFLGKFYQKKKGIFYEQANFLCPKEAIELLRKLGFKSFSCYQTIFDVPGKIHSIERPLRGFGRGGFVAISANKK